MAPAATEDKPAAAVSAPGAAANTEVAPHPDRPTETAPDPGDIEEGRDAYGPGGFHPVYIGDVYAGKYKILNKIGYGVYSTVWLVQDLAKPDGDEHKFLALKILSAESYDESHPVFEREILKHLRDGDRRHMGYKYVCHLVDDFEHQGPNGTHVCLVFELMGETMRTFGALFDENMIPYPVMRRFTAQLLVALDFAHKHNVIHTDIKPDNIFVKFRNRTLIESGYLVEEPIPQQDRAEEKYTPVPSSSLYNHYFGEEDSTRITEFEIALGDWGVASWADRHLTEHIQAVALRAPEVLIEAPWDKTVDWWNLGALLLELYRAVRMFSGRAPPDGHYELKKHVAEIVNLFGPFPKELLEKGNQDIVRSVFDDEGNPDWPPINRRPLASEAFMPGLSPEARDKFDSFLRALMKINPAERLPVENLLRHPWIGLEFRTVERG